MRIHEDPLLSHQCHNVTPVFHEALPNHGFVQCLQLLENAKGDLKAAHKSKLVFSIGKVTCIEGSRDCSSNVNDLCDVMVF